MRFLLSLCAIAFAAVALWPVAGLAVLGLVILASSPSFAAEAASTVSIPWGDFVASIADHSFEILLGLALWGFRQLPASVYSVIQMLRVDQLLERAIDYGVKAVAGAARGKTLDVQVGSQVLALAINYAMENAPLLVKWAGGYDALKAKIFARLDLAPEVSLEAVDAELAK